MKFLLSPILAIAIPIISGALASIATQWSKKAWAALDRSDATVKQTLVGLYALGLNALTLAIGKPVCTNGAAYCDLPDVAFGTIISFAIALAIHGNKKKGS
jgi:hypothetical protein